MPIGKESVEGSNIPSDGKWKVKNGDHLAKVDAFI